MHQVGAVTGHRRTHPRAGHADPESGIRGHRQGRHSYDREAQRAVRARQPAGRLGCDDQYLVAPVDQLLGDAHRGMRDTVDVGREGLCDIGDSHDYTLRDADARPGR